MPYNTSTSTPTIRPSIQSSVHTIFFVNMRLSFHVQENYNIGRGILANDSLREKGDSKL